MLVWHRSLNGQELPLGIVLYTGHSIGATNVERLWKSVKYEEVYQKAYDSVSVAKASLGTYLAFYNTRRPHQSLDGKTLDTIYFAGLPQERIAA